MLKKALIVAFAFMAASCPNQFINSWYEKDGDTRAGGPALPDTCDILLYHFTDPASVGVPGGGSGGPDDPALIAIGYPEGSAVPYDGGIKIYHNGKTVEPAGPWEAGAGGFYRDYTVTAESGKQKHYRVTAAKDIKMALPAENTRDIMLYYFTKPGTEELLSVGKIGAEGDPTVISIGYPEGTSFPVGEGDIHVYHNGDKVEAPGDWDYIGGVFVRDYTVTAKNQAVKHYRVIASKESTAPLPLSETCDILLYYFTDPACLGVPEPGDPPGITITYPAGTSIPDDGKIKTAHNGDKVEAVGGWSNGVRYYKVTAENPEITKTYRVTAKMGAEPPVPGMLLYYFRVPGTEPPQLLRNGKLLLEGRSGTEDDRFLIEITYPAEPGFPAEGDMLYLASGEVEWDDWKDGVRDCKVSAGEAEKFYRVTAVKEQPQAVPVTGVSIVLAGNPVETLVLAPLGEAQLTAAVYPTGGSFSDNEVKWTSSNPGVAAVDQNGKVADAGSAVIVVTTHDGGYTATCAVTVQPRVTGVTIRLEGGSETIETLTLAPGGTQKLIAPVKPDGATDKTVTWSATPGGAATVDPATGVVTAVANAGKTTVTATTNDGGYTASCAVIVGVKVTGVTLSPKTLTLTVGESKTLTAAVSPPDATYKAVQYTFGPAGKVTVEADGLVTGLAQGTAAVTVTTVDGKKTDECTVTVTPAPVPPAPLSDDCDITQYRFTDAGPIGLLVMDTGKGGSMANPALITIGYLYWTDIPGDDGIAITHTGEKARAVDPEDPDNEENPGDWQPSGGNFVRYYLVTAESGTKKYYRVTAAPSFDIHNAEEWQAARTFISNQPGGSAGSPRIFRPNIVGDFAVPGINSGSTITGTYKEVRLTGTGTISLEPAGANGSLIRTAANQSFVIDGPGLQGKAGNNAPLVNIEGSNSAVELRGGSSSFTMTGGTISEIGWG